MDVHLHAFSVCEIQEGWRLTFPPFQAIIVHYVLRGGGSLRVGNGPWQPFAPHSIIVVPTRQPHTMGEAGTAAGEVLAADHCSLLGDGLVTFTAGDGTHDTLLVCGTIPETHASALGLFAFLHDPIVQDCSTSAVQRHAFELMLEEVSSPRIGAQAVTEALMKLCLVRILREHLIRDDLGSPLFTTVHHPKLVRAVLAVLDKPASPHTVESLAMLAGMSRAAFAGHFMRVFQQGPAEFVQKARLRIAAQLLATTALPIKIIAKSVGYASRSYFSRAFRASYGADPSAFRDVSGKVERQLERLERLSPPGSSMRDKADPDDRAI